MFRKHHQTSLKAASDATEGSVIHPLPTLFRLLGLTPFKQVIICYLTSLSLLLHIYCSGLIIEAACAAEVVNVSLDIYPSELFS